MDAPEKIPPHFVAEADQLEAMQAEFGDSSDAIVAAALAESCKDMYNP